MTTGFLPGGHPQERRDARIRAGAKVGELRVPRADEILTTL